MELRLIAAAPEMLALLREALGEIDSLLDFAPSRDVDDTRRAAEKTSEPIRALLARIDGK